VRTEPNLYPRFSEAEYRRRYAAIEGIARGVGAEATVVYGDLGSQLDVHYVSNFLPRRDCYVVLPADKPPAMFVQIYNHWPNSREIAVIPDNRFGGTWSPDTVGPFLKEIGLERKTIAVVGPIPYQHMNRLKSLLPQATFADVTRAFRALRNVKSDEEITWLREAARLTDLAMEAIEKECHSGMTESEWVAIAESAYVRQGGITQIHFLGSTAMGDPHLCLPTQWEAKRRIAKGDVVITEISAYYWGYAGQIHRPIAVGGPPMAPYQRMYDVAVEAYDRIAAVVKPGATAEDVLDAAEFIHRSGYTIYDDLFHGYGGGYLDPVLRTRKTRFEPDKPFTFAKNMVMVIQPNLITADEQMGLQVGSMLRVTDTGVESFHKYPMKFIQVP
jgi:Xaa-Pro aminopeptidase